MDWILALYASQPFWLWLLVGVSLLAIEASFSTEWLLWPAVSAGLVALLSALFPNLGLPIEIGIFAALVIVLTLASKKLIKKVNPADVPDINDQNVRLIGTEARVVETFVNGRGRVFTSGAEWPAESGGPVLETGTKVIIEGVDGTLLKVRPH